MSIPADPKSAPDLAEEFAAAMQWWEGAGVDSDFADDATDWLAQPEPAKPAQAAAKKRKKADSSARSPAERLQAKNLQAPINTSPDALPGTLEEFQKWWLTDASLAAGTSGHRVLPRGPQNAALMVLVPEPEDGDTDMLLCGPDGRMLNAMLRAMRIDAAQVYIASALPAAMPMADFTALAHAGLAQVTARHVKLAAPQRVLILGSGVLPLFAHDMAQDAASLREINHETGTVPAMAARTLANLRNLPGDRARFWRRWLQWTEN